MAQHIKIGSPVNAAERWGFDFLKSHLPESYYLITNVEVYDDRGHPFEVDAVVIGEYGVYLVDVKGYQGRLTASKDIWLFNDRKVENPIPKLNGNARILASRCRKLLSAGQHSPWCQASIFVTGGVGGTIDIDTNGHDKLPVYTAKTIISALTEKEYLASHYCHVLEPYQKDMALQALCDFKLLGSQGSILAGYKKVSKIGEDGPVETWLVQPLDKSLNFNYWMKLVDLTCLSPGEATTLKKSFKHEYSVLSQLAEIPEVPNVLSYWDDGENLALVQASIDGAILDVHLPNDEALIKAVSDTARALLMIHSQGLIPHVFTAENLMVTDGGDVRFVNFIENLVPADNDCLSAISKQFAGTFYSYLFDNVADDKFDPNDLCVSVDGLESWMRAALNDGENASFIDLVDLFLPEQSSDSELVSLTPEVLRKGMVIAEKYELLGCIGVGSTSTVWRARHLLGEYDCAMKVLNDSVGSEDFALKEFEILRTSFHPNIMRIFDLDKLPGTDVFYMIGQYIEGGDLYEVESSQDDLWKYFKQILSALQYLHRINIVHKDVKPQNIVVESGVAYLIDFNISALESVLVGTMTYKAPDVKSKGWSKFSDIYSLVVSFVELATGCHPFSENNDLPSREMAAKLPKAIPFVGPKTRQRIQQVLNHQVDWDAVPDYLSWFGLSNSVDVDLPSELLIQWGIREGYMTKSLLSMVADGQARSRSVVVSNVLKENKLVGSKSTRGSINASISALKSAGVVEDYGKKVRLTDSFSSSVREVEVV